MMQDLRPRGVTSTRDPVHVIGGGLSGSEAAWQLARCGVPVVLHEMRPVNATPVHKTGQFAELVCSNSFRSDDAETSAIGLLHAEMRRLGSLVMRAADAHKLPAGSALAFFDAIAPIVHRDSIDFGIAWFQSRYDKAGPAGSGADYINCPLTGVQYDAFVDALLSGEKIAFHDFESTP